MMDANDRKTVVELLSISRFVCFGIAAVWGYGWVLYHVLHTAHALRESHSDAALAGVVLIGLTGLVLRHVQRRIDE